MSLRYLAANDVRELNNRDWGQPIKLTDPDGIRYETDNVTGDTLKAAQILYDYRKIDPNTGEEITVHEPIVTISKKSLARVPEPGERWYIEMQVAPDEDSALESRVISEIRAPEGGGSLGFIRLYPGKVKQS